MSVLTPDVLWDIPRVGAPRPVAGDRLIVPVTTYDTEGAASTCLWRLDPASGERRRFASGPISGLDASADGASVAYLKKVGDWKQVFVQPVDGGEGRQVGDLPLGSVGVRWLPDGRLVALARLWADRPTLDETRDHDPTSEPEVFTTEESLFRYWDMWLEHVYHPVILDPSNDEVHDLTPGWTRFWRWPNTDEPIDDLAVARDGSHIVISVDDSPPPHRGRSWSLFAIPLDGREAVRLDPDRVGHSRQPRFGPGGELVYGYQAEPDYYASPTQLIWRDPTTGVEHGLAPEWDRSPSEWIVDDDGSLIVVAEEQGRSRLFRLSTDAASPVALTDDGWATRPVIGPSGDIYYLWHSLGSPPEVRSLGRGRLTDFTAAALEDVEMGRVREETFTGANADDVQMWLVDPPGADPEGALPLVHLIHGGPHGSFGDAWHWRWCAQVVAGAGYRVAMVNFHGSTGWGDAWTRSIHGAWGDLPHRDIDAASDHLVGRGWADPDRIAVTGGSYGGYLVSWITSQTDRYRCAIAHAAVTNLGGMYASDHTYGLDRAFGAEIWDDRSRVERWSPSAHASGYGTPTLVVHGRNDARVPDTQGLELYGVLQARGVPSRLVFYPDENHWILSRRNSIHWYGEFLDWLKRWL